MWICQIHLCPNRITEELGEGADPEVREGTLPRMPRFAPSPHDASCHATPHHTAPRTPHPQCLRAYHALKHQSIKRAHEAVSYQPMRYWCGRIDTPPGGLYAPFKGPA